MPDVAHSRVSLRVLGDDLDPADVSPLLGAPPHTSHRKGDANGRYAPHFTGVWSREVAEASPGDIDGQIAELLRPLTSDLAVWQDIARRFRTDLACGVFFSEGNAGFTLSVETLKLIADRHLEIWFDIYGE